MLLGCVSGLLQFRFVVLGLGCFWVVLFLGCVDLVDGCWLFVSEGLCCGYMCACCCGCSFWLLAVGYDLTGVCI